MSGAAYEERVAGAGGRETIRAPAMSRLPRSSAIAALSAIAVFPTPAQLHAARHFAAHREGAVSFAVVDSRGRDRGGLHPAARRPSASVVKAMLLVAYLRRHAHDRLSPPARRLLSPMIRVSDNRAAETIHAVVGDAGLRAVGHAAHMRHLSTGHGLFETGITAGDQARFFWRLDRLLPRRHRAYARTLLATVAPQQRWGVPRAARGRFHVLIKGGWRAGLVHQGARVEWRGHHMALAVLTVGGAGVVYGQQTIQGIAARLLSPVSVARKGSAAANLG